MTATALLPKAAKFACRDNRTHPHPNPPLEGEGGDLPATLPLKGRGVIYPRPSP